MLIAAGANVEAKSIVSGTEYGIRRRGADCRVPPFFPSPWRLNYLQFFLIRARVFET